MAISLNWNAFRKGYREGEVEDQQDAQFLQEQQLRDLRNQEMAAQMQFEAQMRPLRIQAVTDAATATGFNLRGLGRAEEVANAGQAGAISLAGAQSDYRNALANTIDPQALAQQTTDRMMLGGQLQLGQTQQQLDLLPARGALAAGTTQQALDQLPTRGRLFDSAATNTLANDALTRDQIGAERALLPLRTSTTAGALQTSQLDQQFRAGAIEQNISLLGQQGELRRSQLANAITQAAQGTQNLAQRQTLMDLLGVLTNPDQIRINAESAGMTPEVWLDQVGERATQMGVMLNIGAGGSVDSSTFTPGTRASATQTAAMLAGRTGAPRMLPAPTGTRVTGGTAAQRKAAAEAAVNPLIGAAPAAPAAPQAHLFPTGETIRKKAEVKKAVEAVGPPPKVPNTLAPNTVKEFNKSVDWGNFSEDQLKEINAGGAQAGYSPVQILAVQQELYRRALARARGQ